MYKAYGKNKKSSFQHTSRINLKAFFYSMFSMQSDINKKQGL